MHSGARKHSTGNWIGALALAAFPHFAMAAPVWQLNTGGTGVNGAIAMSTIDVAGVGFVQILPSATVPSAFDFFEYGAYRAVRPGSTTALGKHDITIRYSAFGSSSFLDPNALNFTAGSIDIYSDSNFDFATAAPNYGTDNGTLIAGFSIYAGGADGSGLVTLSAEAISGSLLPGYFFSADGKDLSTRNNVTMTLGVYNQTVIADSLMVSGVICGLAGYTGPGCDGEPFVNTPLAFAVQDGGYAIISSVPEPETLSLLLAGLGLLSLVHGRRRSGHRPQSATAPAISAQ